MLQSTCACRFVTTILLTVVLAACGGEGASGDGSTGKPPGSPPAPKNTPPSISGTPLTSVTADSAYAFQPRASDADGDPLLFQVSNKPAWATFDAASGRLSGTPQAADVGTYSNIVISVSDSQATTALPAFSVTVAQIQTGTATLSWDPPTENTDGSPLSDLAGYRIRWGRDPSQLDEVQGIPNPGITTMVVEGLAQGTWYFTVSAYNRDGVESDPSNVALMTVM